jgi:hypothetical protein
MFTTVLPRYGLAILFLVFSVRGQVPYNPSPFDNFGLIDA